MAFDIFADLKISDGEGAKAIESTIKELIDTQVLVGIPESEAAREEGKLTNVELMYIHSNGSPLAGIPARPVIEPALENAKNKIGTLMSDAAQAALSGNQEEMNANLEKAGLAGQSASQDWFTNPSNAWSPNTEATKKAKGWKGSTDPKPLIDTGELRRSITYVVRSKSESS